MSISKMRISEMGISKWGTKTGNSKTKNYRSGPFEAQLSGFKLVGVVFLRCLRSILVGLHFCQTELTQPSFGSS